MGQPDQVLAHQLFEGPQKSHVGVILDIPSGVQSLCAKSVITPFQAFGCDDFATVWKNTKT